MADFDSLEKKIDALTQATTEGFKRVEERFGELENQIDTLAISTSKEFDSVHKEFDEVKERIGNLETHADVVNQKLERIDRNIGTLMDASASLETRVTKLETTVH